LEWESKKAAASGSAMLGYQSVDDFFDTNALLVESTDLFPKGSVQIQGMKVFSGAKMDEVLLDAASLVCHAGSMLQNAFHEMIPDHEALRPVEQYVCEDGLGLCGWIANRRVLFGNREMMASHNIEGIPTKTRESELVEGKGDVLYLSISGVLSALFSVRITADPMVKRQMQALKQEKIALVIRSIDSSVTLKRLATLFSFPEQQMKILPTSMHNLFERETASMACVSASMTVGGNGFGAAGLLLGARRVRRAAMLGVIVQIVSALLGLSLAIIHMVTGSYEMLTAQFFCLYHLILTGITVLAVRVR
jgi:Cu+-exporting ATPase